MADSPGSDKTRVDLGEDLLRAARAEQDLVDPLHTTSDGAVADLDDQIRSAEILFNEGLSEDAKAVYRRILISDPHHLVARRRLEEIHELELKQLFSESNQASRVRVPSGISTDELLRDLERALGIEGSLDAEDSAAGSSLFPDAKSMDGFVDRLGTQLKDLGARERIDVGIAFLQMGLYPVAVAQFEAACRVSSEPEIRTEAHGLMAYSLILSGKPLDAASILEPLIADSEIDLHEKVELMYLMGRANEAMQRKGSAKWWYSRVLAIQPHYRDIDDRQRALGSDAVRESS